MDLQKHAEASANIRRAAEYARGITDNLNKLNAGPVFDRDTTALREQVERWFKELATSLGYIVAKEPV